MFYKNWKYNFEMAHKKINETEDYIIKEVNQKLNNIDILNIENIKSDYLEISANIFPNLDNYKNPSIFSKINKSDLKFSNSYDETEYFKHKLFKSLDTIESKDNIEEKKRELQTLYGNVYIASCYYDYLKTKVEAFSKQYPSNDIFENRMLTKKCYELYNKRFSPIENNDKHMVCLDNFDIYIKKHLLVAMEDIRVMNGLTTAADLYISNYHKSVFQYIKK